MLTPIQRIRWTVSGLELQPGSVSKFQTLVRASI
jgi:hypothetical protein